MLLNTMTMLDDLTLIKSTYRQIFLAANTQINDTFDALRVNSQCSTPSCACQLESFADTDITQTFPKDCGHRGWQQASLEFLEQGLAKQVVQRLQGIKTERDKVDCHSCGVCCRLASSEFSYDQLLDKAKAGDWFAQQFTSVFLPYESTDAARKAFPSIVKQVHDYSQTKNESESPDNTESPSIHFYHCPYIGDDNRCTIYGTPKRPEICASYPETPLTFIYDKCAWRDWKDTNHQDSLTAHATIELIGFLSGQIRQALSN